jgi:molybdate transport system substrate-binding protein
MANGAASLGFVLMALSPAQAAETSVSLFAAGSLSAALGEVATAYERAYGVAVDAQFAPSGLLRQAIEAGEQADLFASANMKHPETLAATGAYGPVVPFARNSLCAIARPGLAVSTDTILDLLLDTAVRVGTSTPGSDPAGDYAWTLFRRADAIRPGALAILDAKALKLTGGPDSAKPPEGRNPYAWVMTEDRADLFLTYCTNALAARQDSPQLQMIALPPPLDVGADYGLTVRTDADPAAWRLAMFILAADGQTILRAHGFSPVAQADAP